MNTINNNQIDDNKTAALFAVIAFYAWAEGVEDVDEILGGLRLWIGRAAQGVYTVADRITHNVELDGGSLTDECESAIHDLLCDVKFRRFQLEDWIKTEAPSSAKADRVSVRTTNEAARDLEWMIEGEDALADDLSNVEIKFTKVGGYVRFDVDKANAVLEMASLAADIAGEAVYNVPEWQDDYSDLEAHADACVTMCERIEEYVP